jgi:predicted RNA-binding Zn-ribbon protein involved in translation (DUF1610 family)
LKAWSWLSYQLEVRVSQIPFVCPNCGGNKFRVSSEPKDLNEMIGAPCDSCGTPLTEDAVKKQAAKIAEDAIKKTFLEDSGFMEVTVMKYQVVSGNSPEQFQTELNKAAEAGWKPILLTSAVVESPPPMGSSIKGPILKLVAICEQA